MYTTKRKISLCFIVAVIAQACLLLSCSRDDHDAVIKGPEPMEIEIPENFPDPVYPLQNNPVTKQGFALGKKLFYDARLSRNNTISCGFCHLQPFAFTHHGHDVSHGIDDLLGRRNSLPIQNLVFYNSFFWDGGVHNLDLVPLNAIKNPVEMDQQPDSILAKLRKDDQYPQMFEAAFGTREITSEHFLQALSQFLCMLISANSRYDLYVRGDEQILEEDEKEGMQLFKQHCSACHATDLFTDQSYRNNGFSREEDFARDKGRAEITLDDNDIGKFKVPGLRNVEYTAPYMHNGRLLTLEAVLDFYTDHVQATATLDTLLKQHEKPGFDLTGDEKKKIIAFLKTLSDEEFLSNRQFSEF